MNGAQSSDQILTEEVWKVTDYVVLFTYHNGLNAAQNYKHKSHPTMHKSFAFVSNEAYNSGLEYYAKIMLMQTGDYWKILVNQL